MYRQIAINVCPPFVTMVEVLIKLTSTIKPSWGVDVEPVDSEDEEEYTLNLQVWRPSPTLGQMGSGVYIQPGAPLKQIWTASVMSRH